MAIVNKTYNNVVGTLCRLGEYHQQITTVSVGDIFDINLYLDDTAYAVTYGYFEISSKSDENVNFLFSTTDGVKLFVNNNYQHAYAGNTFSSIEDYISVPLNKGINRIVLKMPNKDWDWKIKVKILNDYFSSKRPILMEADIIPPMIIINVPNQSIVMKGLICILTLIDC